ncbi:hypothetical protein KM427_01010 [Nocardioides sp. LMS-CY]|uniref:hypothetical protein n=1 Tax=Nocardioides sp. (strain LMS-CY) TaxID=2840457 RepID=UPI001C005352|nr:hypothetical protein [Nocardioides sp. LMS-CY]QWF22367.1 hypothetical protein KM427_01010 [Nocardioides sp. LMS-CY]
MAESAWVGLIATPGLAIPLATEELTGTTALQHRFGLVTVYKQPEEDLTKAGLRQPRLAVTSHLTLTLTPQTRFIESAVLRSAWHISTPSLLAELDALRRQALPGTVTVRTTRRITLLVQPDFSERLTDTDRARLQSASQLMDSALDVVDRGRIDAFSVQRRLAGTAGGSLIVVGPLDTATRSLRDSYLDVDPHRLVRYVAGNGNRDVSETILEQVTELSGLSASLLPIVPADRSPKGREVRAPIPITNPVKCLHHGNRFYLQDGDTGLWWTRDDDRHAGTIFKTYTERNSALEHEADRDADGVIINKHKGPSGLRISTSELRGCPKRPHKHLG